MAGLAGVSPQKACEEVCISLAVVMGDGALRSAVLPSAAALPSNIPGSCMAGSTQPDIADIAIEPQERADSAALLAEA